MNESYSDKRPLYSAIQEHFPYELDILEHAFVFLQFRHRRDAQFVQPAQKCTD